MKISNSSSHTLFYLDPRQILPNFITSKYGRCIILTVLVYLSDVCMTPCWLHWALLSYGVLMFGINMLGQLLLGSLYLLTAHSPHLIPVLHHPLIFPLSPLCSLTKSLFFHLAFLLSIPSHFPTHPSTLSSIPPCLWGCVYATLLPCVWMWSLRNISYSVGILMKMR